jgi:hypothetical protein
MRTRILVLAGATLLLASPEASVAAGPGRGWCGALPGRPLDTVWAHRERASRSEGRHRLASSRDTSFAVGQIAVLMDEGELALLRNALDLANTSVSFTPVPGGYRVARGATPLAPDAGTPVALSDDDSREVALPFAFPFFGESYNRAFVNSDGNLTFGARDSASTPRRIGRLVGGPARVAPLLTDLDPSTGGAVTVQALGDRFVVTWRAVPTFDTQILNTLQAVLHADGRLDFVYGDLNETFDEGVTGIAPGAGAGGVLAVDFANASGQSGGGAIAESFRSGSQIDEVAVARKYFQSFPDEVQQLVVFTDRRLAGVGTFAYEQGVKNEISGLGDETYDFSAEYGSAGRLESFVMMDVITKYPEDPSTLFLAGVDSALSVLAHESGHRWLTRALFRDPSGTVSDALLGRQLAHWSFFMNSSASFLEGNEIQDLGAGQFRTTGSSLRYGPLDQYLMGLRSPEEVPSFFYVADVPVTAGSREQNPAVGVLLTGTRRDVSIGDVIAAIGPRLPSASRAPTVLRQAFVFVASQDPPSEAVLAKLERLRAAFPAFYAAGTEGRGQVDPRVN